MLNPVAEVLALAVSTGLLSSLTQSRPTRIPINLGETGYDYLISTQQEHPGHGGLSFVIARNELLDSAGAPGHSTSTCTASIASSASSANCSSRRRYRFFTPCASRQRIFRRGRDPAPCPLRRILETW